MAVTHRDDLEADLPALCAAIYKAPTRAWNVEDVAFWLWQREMPPERVAAFPGPQGVKPRAPESWRAPYVAALVSAGVLAGDLEPANVFQSFHEPRRDHWRVTQAYRERVSAIPGLDLDKLARASTIVHAADIAISIVTDPNAPKDMMMFVQKNRGGDRVDALAYAIKNLGKKDDDG